jgi:hypothetical protein
MDGNEFYHLDKQFAMLIDLPRKSWADDNFKLYICTLILPKKSLKRGDQA